MVGVLRARGTIEDDLIFQIVHAMPIDLTPLQKMCLYTPQLVTLCNWSALVKLLV